MKNIPFILLFLITAPVSAQLFPLSDFYLFNGLTINPAFAGSQDALSTALHYRNQWVGFKDGPRSSMISAHAPVFYDRMGLGLMINRNSYGIYKETSIMGNYAYRSALYNGKLALGIAFGVTAYRVSWDELDAVDPDDLLLAENAMSAVLPDFSVGAYYSSEKYFAGFSIPFFLSHETVSGDYKIQNRFDDYNYFFTGGYIFSIIPNLEIQPSVLLKYNSHTGIQGDYYLQAELYHRIMLGAGYRSTGMMMGLLTCHVNRQLSVSYSFDTDSGKTGNYKKGSHEIMVGYIFQYAREVMSPAEL